MKIKGIGAAILVKFGVLLSVILGYKLCLVLFITNII
jgi:hypothetical protein